MSARRQHPEQAIQAAIFQHLSWRGAPGVYVFHVPNGGLRSKSEARVFASIGVRRGVPDIIAVHQGRCYALEIKAENGRATDAQWQAIEDLRAAGAHAEVCYGLDRALAVLEGWGLLRGRVQ
jgi:hypothetical protein